MSVSQQRIKYLLQGSPVLERLARRQYYSGDPVTTQSRFQGIQVKRRDRIVGDDTNLLALDVRRQKTRLFKKARPYINRITTVTKIDIQTLHPTSPSSVREAYNIRPSRGYAAHAKAFKAKKSDQGEVSYLKGNAINKARKASSPHTRCELSLQQLGHYGVDYVFGATLICLYNQVSYIHIKRIALGHQVTQNALRIASLQQGTLPIFSCAL